jgi:hypothetical protein
MTHKSVIQNSNPSLSDLQKDILGETKKGGKWELVKGDLIFGEPYYFQTIDSTNRPEAFIIQISDKYTACIPQREDMIKRPGHTFRVT